MARWDGRWTLKVERGEELVAAGRWEEAIAYLQPLDRAFPARDVRHARDTERERILRALGRAYEDTGRKRLSLETYRRLVAFDTRNYRNHLALARTATLFDEPEEALLHYRHILEIHPSHLPSLAAIMTSGL